MVDIDPQHVVVVTDDDEFIVSGDPVTPRSRERAKEDLKQQREERRKQIEE